MKRVGKVVVLDSIPGASSKSKDASETNDYFAKLVPALETANINDLPVLDLPEAMQNRLMDHQKIGVRWLHSLYLNSSGGILGDDMGLGKTYQVICLLAGLMQQQLIKRVLILAPVSVLPNWQIELLEHLQPHVPGLEVFLTNSDLTKKKRIQILDSTFHNSVRRYAPKIVISSYHLVSNMVDDFANRGRWDYVILDEGHVIKNPSTKISKSMHLLSSNHRLILTGTPIQNNLNEFWAIVNWATKGKRFGTLSGFKEDYTMPIVQGQDPKASPEQRRIAEEAAQNLLALTKPIILQRKKCELPSNDQLNLPTKIELVVWSPLASSQRELYEQFIHSRQFSSALNRSTCPVEVINHLKTVCRHPLLIEALEMNRKRRDQATSSQPSLSPRPARTQSHTASQQNRDEDDEMDFLSHGLADMSMQQDGTGEEEGELEEVLKSLPTNASVFDVVNRDPDVRELLRGSIKLRILLKLVHRLHFAGHRTLVFSQSRLMLDIIQRVFVEYGLASHRIDGSVRSSERQRIIDEYNDTSEDSVGPSICLLTTKACGFGITLTGADRVIIYDPSWNPAEDRQAVDRAYRIGQTKPVVVYRLIMASSVEEKMYEKQVFKDGIRVVTESGTSSRYFSKNETTELFTLGPVDQSVVMERLWTAAGENIREFPDTRGELPSVLGFTRHDTLYTEARPNASSQGQDAYSQYVDPDHIPSDSEDEMVGVPATPAGKSRPKTAPVSALKRPTQTPGKENILNALNRMRDLANSQKANTQEDAFDLRSPEPLASRGISSAFDLTSPAAVRMSGASAFSQVSDLTCDSPLMSQEQAEMEYAQLSGSKLYQGSPSPVPAASPVRLSTPLCSDSDESDEKEEDLRAAADKKGGPNEASENGSAIKPEPEEFNGDNYWEDNYVTAQEEETGEESDENQETGDDEEESPWNDATVAAFNVLKEQKLFSPPESPAGLSCPRAVNHPISPSMSQVETQPQFGFPEDVQSTGNTEYDTAMCETASDSCEEHSEEHTMAESDYLDACDDPIGRLLQSVLPIVNNVDEAEQAEHEQQAEEDCDPIGRLLQSVLPASGMRSPVPLDSDFDALFGAAQSNESEVIEDEAEEKADEATVDEETVDEETVNEGVAEEASLEEERDESEEGGLDPLSSSPSPFCREEVDAEELEDEQDMSECGILDEQEELAEKEEGEEGEEGEEHDQHEQIIARRATLLLNSEESSQVTECDETVDGANEANEANELSFGDEIDEAYSDEDDHFSFPAVNEHHPTAGTEHRKSRGGGYLLNLCEMGSMKRTSSMHSNASDINTKSAEGETAGADLGESLEDCAPAVEENCAPQFTSPEATAQEGVGGTAAKITTRKKKSPVFSNYMEPDLFASPPWMASSVFSPEVAQRGSLRHTNQETPSSEPSNDPKSAIFASGGTEIDDEDEEENSIAGSSPVGTFHDPLQDLVDQVRGLDLAAAATSTPMSKISFQTTAGQYSNMIVKAQSVSRLQRSFAQLSDSESDSESDGSAETSPASQCTQNTPSMDAVERMSCEKGLENGPQSPIVQAAATGTPIAPPTGETLCSEEYSVPSSAERSPVKSSQEEVVVPLLRAALFHSPAKRRSSMWRRLSTGTVSSVISSVSEESVEVEESAESAEEEDNAECHEQQSPSPIRAPVLHTFDEATVESVDDEFYEESPERSQTTNESEETLGFDLFRDFVVPPLMMDHNCVTDSNNKVLRALGLNKFAFPVHRPHYALSEDDIDTYNDFLLQGGESEQIEKYHSAATFYERALELCDEDVALHGKLAWLLDVLSNS